MAPASDQALERKPTTLMIEWSEKITLGRYDFSSITFVNENSDTTYLIFGGTDQGGWYAEGRVFDKTIEPVQPIFWTRFGWSPDYFHEWFGRHAANFIEITIKDQRDYCYAFETSQDKFTYVNGKDDYGSYVDLKTGPINIKQSSSACAGTPSFTPAGTIKLTMRYRCTEFDHGRRAFPKWACPDAR